MNQDILSYIMNHAGSLSLQEILVNFIAAIAVGGVIFLSYRFSHSGALYSGKFNVSLWMLTLVTTLVMCVIGNNIALSLGMVGALSIVRFRTAIKDARDTAYIFWAVAAGICCGISDFMIAVLGSVVIFLLMLVLGNIQGNNRYLLIVRGGAAAGEKIEQRHQRRRGRAPHHGRGEKIEQAVQEVYGGKARLCVKNSARESVEYIYELSQKLLQRTENVDISERLFQMDSVETVDLVSQNDEITS